MTPSPPYTIFVHTEYNMSTLKITSFTMLNNRNMILLFFQLLAARKREKKTDEICKSSQFHNTLLYEILYKQTLKHSVPIQ